MDIDIPLVILEISIVHAPAATSGQRLHQASWCHYLQEVSGHVANIKTFVNAIYRIKEGLYRIQILCRQYPFWSYPAGLQ